MRKRVTTLLAGLAAAAVAVVVPFSTADAANPVNVPGTAGPTASGGSGFVSSGVTVKGNVTVSASGTVSDAGSSNVGPGGSGSCSTCFQSTLPRLALIAQIGNAQWQLVGAGPTTLKGNGALQFAVNDSAYGDNTGAFSASISSGTGTTATSLTITASASRITAGQPVTLGTTLTRGGSPLANASVTLLAKLTGAATFGRVVTLTTDANGVAKSTRRPRFNTTYEWQFAGNGNSSSSTSPTKAIAVRTRVTEHVFDATLGSGQPLVVWGVTSPAKPGIVITIYRHTQAGNTKLGAVRVRKDGSWGFSHRVPAGSATVFAHIAATAHNAAGNSVRLSFSRA